MPIARTLIEVYLHIVISTKRTTSWLRRQEAVSRDFSWHDGYGGFSAGLSELPGVRRYMAA